MAKNNKKKQNSQQGPSTGQQVAGQAGPWGAAIAQGSKMGTDATSSSDNPYVASLGSGLFNPSSNLDALSDDSFSTGQKAASLLLPGFKSFFEKKNQNKEIQAQDALELQRLAEINRIRKSIGAGTDPLTQQKIAQAQQTGASTQGRLARSTGGNVGATIAALTRAQRGTQAATNQALAQTQQRLPFFENLSQQLSTRISQRSLELGLQKRDQRLAEKAASARARNANMAGAIGLAGNAANGLGNQQQAPSGGGAESLGAGAFGAFGSSLKTNEAPLGQNNAQPSPQVFSQGLIQGLPQGGTGGTPDLSGGSGISGVSQDFDSSQIIGQQVPTQQLAPSSTSTLTNASNIGFNNINNLGNAPL